MGDIHSVLDQQGFITRPQVFQLGGDDDLIADRLRRQIMTRIGPGLYVPRHFHKLRPEDQHVIRAQAVWTRFGDRIAFSHHTAAVLHGIAVWDVDLDVVHCTRRDGGRSRVHRGVTHHKRSLTPDEITSVAGVSTVTPARAVWDMATDLPIDVALVSVDSGLNQNLFAHADLLPLAQQNLHWRGARRAKMTFSLSDPLAESPGETRTRFAMYRAGIPKPEAQYKIYDRHGNLIGVTDFAWPKFRHIAEFDGLLKYESAIDLSKEKAREDALRKAGWGVTRIVWSQLAPSLVRVTMSELREAMEQSRRQFTNTAA